MPVCRCPEISSSASMMCLAKIDGRLPWIIGPMHFEGLSALSCTWRTIARSSSNGDALPASREQLCGPGKLPLRLRYRALAGHEWNPGRTIARPKPEMTLADPQSIWPQSQSIENYASFAIVPRVAEVAIPKLGSASQSPSILNWLITSIGEGGPPFGQIVGPSESGHLCHAPRKSRSEQRPGLALFAAQRQGRTACEAGPLCRNW